MTNGFRQTIYKYSIANALFCLLLLLLLLLCAETTLSTNVQLHIQANKLSTRNDNDSFWMRQVMRRAKSAEMRGYMHLNVDACEDFFEYSCGNWAKINPANNAQPRETNFYDLLSKAYHHRQLSLLQSGIEEENESEDTDAERKVKNFYASCARLSKKQKDLKQYKYQLRQIINEFGHMPALLPEGTWRASDFDWLMTTGSIQHKYGIDIILQIGIRPDFDNMTQNKIFIGEPTLHLGTKSMYTGEATKWHRDQYRLEIQKQLETHLGLTEERANITAIEILEFEIQLAHGLFNQRLAKTLRSLAKLRTRDELRTAYAPVLDLEKFLIVALGYPLNDSAYEYMLEYQENLVRVLKKTPKEQQANYIFYQLIKTFFYELGETAVKQQEHCLQKTKTFFAKVLDNTYYRRFVTESQKSEVETLWNTLKETFKAELHSDKLNWITLITRQLALEKLEAMQLEINSYASTNFTEEYAELTVNSIDYIENLKQLLTHGTKRALATLNSPPKPMEDPLKFTFTPAYIATENLIKIPVALLQPNFMWSIHYPKALKFGTLGYLIAHELLHGFDDMGCNYDLNGMEKLWWDTNTTKAFNERKACFKRQYSHYLYGGKYLPESDLQAENIADNGAVQMAYTAYRNWLTSLSSNDNGIVQMESMPHMNFTGQQLFFISFAQFWCNDVNERLKDRVSLVDLHAPAMFRVIGSLANFNEFAKEFSCARGTTMNPEVKCQIY